MTWHHDHDDLTRALTDEARADAARPVPPLVQRVLEQLPERTSTAVDPVRVLPDVSAARPWRAAAGLLICGTAVTAALLWASDNDAQPPARHADEQAADELAPMVAEHSAGDHEPHAPPEAVRDHDAADDDAAGHDAPDDGASEPDAPRDVAPQWEPAIPLAPLSPSPAVAAASQGPPTMVHRLFHPRLPDEFANWTPLKRPVARVQAAATGAGVRVQAQVVAMLARLLWPLRQALTNLDR